MQKARLLAALAVVWPLVTANAGVQFYGDENLLGTGTYSSDPTAGATLQGLAPGAVTYASLSFAHGYPFSPAPGEYPGTDQIYVGSNQTGAHDGYSTSPQRIAGPQVITLDYSSLVPAGYQVSSFTLGIAADDFQFPSIGNPFTASINGTVNTALTTALNSLNQSGPLTQFLTVGIDPATLAANNVLTLSINEGGDGGDGWAVDFLTSGVTTTPVPEPSTVALVAVGAVVLGGIRRQTGRRSAAK